MTRIDNPAWRLRDGFTAPIPVNDVNDPLLVGELVFPRGGRLGYKKFGTHKPQLKLTDYYDRALAQPPSAVSRPHLGFRWGMLANDRLGDCVCAMMLHSIEEFHLDAQTGVPGFTDADAILLYEEIGGYKPDDPSTDQGCDENLAMKAWEKGLPKTSDGVVHKIEATVAVDPQDLIECRIAISEFAVLQIGIDLPASAQGQSEWTVVGNPDQDPGSQPGSWGGHGIPYREYDPDTFKCVTWGAELLLTVPFHTTYVPEAHVVVTPEMLNKDQVGPSGVHWPDLLSDIKKFNKAQATEAEPEPKRPEVQVVEAEKPESKRPEETPRPPKRRPASNPKKS